MSVNTQIDSLVLDISVKDGKGKSNSAYKIDRLDKALEHFQKTVKSLDVTGFKSKFKSMTTALNPFVKKLKDAQNSLKQLNAMARLADKLKEAQGGSTKVGKTKVNVGENGNGTMPAAQTGGSFATRSQRLGGSGSVNKLTQSLEALTDQYGKLRKQVTDTDGKSTLYFEKYEKDSRITKKFTAQLDDQGNVIKDSFKEINTTADNVSGDGLKAFFLSIKRIALYRAIRTSLKVIVGLFREGIANVAAFDETTRRSMSEISSSFTVIKNSIGVAFKPLIELVAPLMRTLARQIGEVANAISYQTAKLRGQTRVLKVNTEYFEEMNRQSHLLDFDQFSVLSNMNTASDMFQEVPIEEMDQYYEDHKGILETVKAIEIALATIGGLKIITWLTGTGFAKFYKFMTGIGGVFTLIMVAIETISDIINWDETTTMLQKVWNIITLILVAVAAIAGIVAAFLPTGGAKIAKAIAFTATLAAAGSMFIGKAQAHADGGMFEGQGTMYHLAGESGAEIVAKGSRGTGVTNIDQFTTAMVNALAEYGAAQKNTDSAPMIVEIDGHEIARVQVRNNANELMRNYKIELKPR